MSRYQFIEQVAATEPVQVLCRVLEVSDAGYYQWLGRADRSTPNWKRAATAAFSRHGQRYGTRCLRAELIAHLAAVPWLTCAEHPFATLTHTVPAQRLS